MIIKNYQYVYMCICAIVLMFVIGVTIYSNIHDRKTSRNNRKIKEVLKNHPELVEAYQRLRVIEETYLLRRLEFNKTQKAICSLYEVDKDECREEREKYKELQVELDRLRNEKILCENVVLSMEKAYGLTKTNLVDLPVEVHYSDFGQNISDKDYEEVFSKLDRIDKIINE